MFNLQLDWDRPAKVSSQLSEHILRVRILPSSGDTPRQAANLPLQLAIALDTSASMQGEKWEGAKAATQALAAQLRASDRLSIASFADWVTPLVQNLQNSQLDQLQSVLKKLVAEGVTRTDLALSWIQSELSSDTGRARVGILITDGHPTTGQGAVLEDAAILIEQAKKMAEDGISLCTVGLGNAADFNSALLVSLSDRGQGTFMYADNPTLLTPQLQERLQAVQAIAVTDATLNLNLATGVKLKRCCRLRPDYLPLTETTSQEIHLRNLRVDTATDVLLALEVPALSANQLPGNYAIAQVQLSSSPSPSPALSLQVTPSYREAQQVNQEVDRDRLCWDINRYSTELTLTHDPLLTGELLSQIQVAALKSGQTTIANEASQQLDNLHKTGKLTAHQTTGLLRSTRQLNYEL
ncbi:MULTISPECIES: vWA domain-containing protein [Nostocales]|uniref:VWA domain-containing protein n=3 Tax=Nostocales TaxID=1161 RepID=A0A0C1R490_9CYAN|nr:VWA domain-containing protein [Tolypothrix bouteillei]KAF3889443.1 VWA domain-containing protein [Tolypothrix bouteillei VB521301]